MVERSPIEDFKGREVTIDFRNNTFQGTVDVINYVMGYVDLRPSLAFSIDDKSVRLETELPVRLSLKLFEKEVLYAITPHPLGYLEQKVCLVNTSSKKEPLGFRASNT